MRAREILILPGISGMSSALNHRASRISSLSILMSPPAYSAVKPIINESGKGQGWLPKYRMFFTSMPASSFTSRLTASSRVSPGSTKPARTLKRPSLNRGERASSALPSCSTSTIIAGEIRGKLTRPHCGHSFARSWTFCLLRDPQKLQY